MIKKLLCICAALSAGLCLFCGCGTDYLKEYDDGSLFENVTAETKGALHSAASAYEIGVIDEADLEAIAYFYNSDKEHPAVLREAVGEAVKRAYADLWNDIKDVNFTLSAEDLTVVNFYGYYKNCCALTLDSHKWNFPTEMPDRWEKVYGVDFHVTDHDVLVVWEML